MKTSVKLFKSILQLYYVPKMEITGKILKLYGIVDDNDGKICVLTAIQTTLVHSRELQNIPIYKH